MSAPFSYIRTNCTVTVKKMLVPQCYRNQNIHSKIQVWAAISKQGASKIRLFEEIIDSTFYVENILRNTLVPFIQSKFGGNDGHRFQQDNDPKRTSKLSKQFMNENQINWWNDWPAGNYLICRLC